MSQGIQINIKKYPAYKDSGVEWLGKIPECWEPKRVKSLFRLIIEPAPKNNNEELLSVYTDIGVKPRKDLEERGNKASTTDGYWRVRKGDVIVNKLLAWMGAIGVSDYDGVTSPAYDILRARKEVNGRFFHYMFRMPSCVSELKRHSRGIMDMRLRLYFDKFGDVVVPFPSLPEQTAIANFLDDKTAKIDQAIAQKEKMIALLKERKQIIIQNAVTKGLDPKVKLRDSGVEWIGEIPEHWEVKKLFGVCHFVRGNSTFSKEELLGKGEYVALQYGKAYKVTEVDEKYEFYVNNEFYKASQVVNHGDTIFISTSETIEDLGHTVFYNRNDLGLLGGEQMLLKPKSETVNSKYLHFSSKVFSKELRKYATGIKVFRFNINDLKTIYTPIPPIDEQNVIVQHIELQLNKIEQAMLHQQAQIEKLKEYKATLIDSAVMGKIKVSF
ncbi:restriction endonuclease subunit S [Fulvivirga ligni]|uniref:restriction endonuclease subunit S n=1 Tax=Fulvivirga ligni TaxID=2904246 RepID=UPI001F229AA9|nr:restriction endonuclease subunit S [Fulvivirga ligni]UII21657.1 restriction endonuclease subunit S [Fulvivirga ligni]